MREIKLFTQEELVAMYNQKIEEYKCNRLKVEGDYITDGVLKALISNSNEMLSDSDIGISSSCEIYVVSFKDDKLDLIDRN